MSNDSAAFVLGAFLIEQGIFGDPDASQSAMLWPLYVSHLPDVDDVVDDAAAIYDTDGIKDGRLMGRGPSDLPSDQGLNVDHDGVQIRVRALDAEDGAQKIQAVAKYLAKIIGAGVTVNGTGYVLNNVSQAGTPGFMGVEPSGKRRTTYFANFRTTITVGQGATPPIVPDQSGVLENGVSKALLTFALLPGDVKGGDVEYFVKVSDGTNTQGVSGDATFVASRGAGAVDGNVQANAENPAVVGSSGTSVRVDGYFDGSDPNAVKVGLTVTVAGFTPTTMQIFFTPTIH